MSNLITLSDGRELTPQELRKFVQGHFQGGGNVLNLKFLEIMLAKHYLAPDSVGVFIANAERRGLSLSDEALATNVLNNAELTEILALQFNIPLADMSQEQVNLGFAKLMDPFQAREFGALPIRYEKDSEATVILITRPDNIAAQEEVPLILNIDRNKIQWKLINSEEYEQVLKRVYENEEDDRTVENLDLRADSSLDSRAVKIIQRLVANAQTQGVSDIHFDRVTRGEMLVRYRVDGVLRDEERLDSKSARLVIGVLKGMSKVKYDETRRSQDGSIKRDFGYGVINLRLVTLPGSRGEEIVLRLLDNRMTSKELDELGLEGSNMTNWESQLQRKTGMVIVTGITGAGKTTTLYAALKKLISPEIKIITLEDPVETELEGVTQIRINPEQGVTFADQLVRILRADPDIIMIGEVRDRETANIAVEAALTGHLVLTTLHTKDAVSAISRLAEMGVERYLLSDSISMLTAQRLVRILCPHCKEPTILTKEVARENGAPIKLLNRIPAGGVKIFQASEGGCRRCRGTGYRKRTGVHEVIPVTESLSGMIAAGATADQLREQVSREGYPLIKEDAFRKILTGETDIAEYKRVISSTATF